MNPVQLFALTAGGPRPLSLPVPLHSIHDLPEELPLGVYTAFRTFEHNKFLGLEDHLARLEQSMALLDWKLSLDQKLVRQALHQVTTAYPLPEARVRLDVLAAPIPLPDHDHRESRILLALAPFVPVPPEHYQKGVCVALAPHLHREQPQAKTADFVLARRDYPLGQPGAYDYLLLDEDRRLLEGSSSNFYAVQDGVIWTAENGVLEGITRKIVLQLAQQMELEVRLEAVTLDEVGRLHEAFLSSSSRGILPIQQIDGQLVGDGRPGPVTQLLLAAYQDFVDKSIRPAVAQ